jgi:hypothetical protein
MGAFPQEMGKITHRYLYSGSLSGEMLVLVRYPSCTLEAR